MGKRSFTRNPNFCFIQWKHPDSACFFDWWSIHHFYWQGFFYLLLHYFLKIRSIKSALLLTVVLTLLHIIEEYLGNTSKYSLEGIVIDNLGPVINPKIDPKLRRPDNDLENSIGDVTAGLIANLLLVFYWYYFKELPWFYLIFLIAIIAMTLSKSSMLYPKKEKLS